ncbi:Ribonuclease/ribotoxin [Xylariaceae sp. FL0255]|nr:Ribonuclease/ribotoxin [Xylariaceae sp. FL0255]
MLSSLKSLYLLSLLATSAVVTQANAIKDVKCRGKLISAEDISTTFRYAKQQAEATLGRYPESFENLEGIFAGGRKTNWLEFPLIYDQDGHLVTGWDGRGDAGPYRVVWKSTTKAEYKGMIVHQAGTGGGFEKCEDA